MVEAIIYVIEKLYVEENADVAECQMVEAIEGAKVTDEVIS